MFGDVTALRRVKSEFKSKYKPLLTWGKHGDDEEDEETTKSTEGSEILKSLCSSLETELHHVRYNTTEVEFLKSVLGYTDNDIQKGVAKITGKNRILFQDWMQDRLNKSISSLFGGRLG